VTLSVTFVDGPASRTSTLRAPILVTRAEERRQH